MALSACGGGPAQLGPTSSVSLVSQALLLSTLGLTLLLEQPKLALHLVELRVQLVLLLLASPLKLLLGEEALRLLLRLGLLLRLLGGLFVTGYGLSRFAIEFFREPDAQLGILSMGLTMGQLLSLPMILLGLFLIGTCNRREPAPLPVPAATA